MVNINKISNISIQKQVLKINTKKSLAKEVLPLVSVPLVVYNVSPHAKKELTKNLTEEATNKALNNTTNHPVTDRYDTNLKALKNSGLKESDAKQHINSNGYIDKEGKEICRKHSQTNFKGSTDTYEAQKIESEQPNYELQSKIDEIDATDTSMCPELEHILHTPLPETPQGLLKSIFGDIPEGFDGDMNLLNSMKKMIMDVLNPEEWF